MESLWRDDEAALCADDIALRVYTSRLLGKSPELVLHGGGNTSVKRVETDLFGEERELLYVKGSGWDLATIEAAGFSPVRMDHLLKLAQLPALTDVQMARELRVGLTNPAAPDPSVEAILHALLPHRFVDHTHADAVVTVTNSPNGEARIREIYGDRVVVVPYIMPGFLLARLCAERFAADAGPQTVGMVLLNHGIFTFGETAKDAYERMIALVSEAEAYLEAQGAWTVAAPDTPPAPVHPIALADLRRDLAAVAGFPVVLRRHADPASLHFALHADIVRISQQGPATPDHVIRTKRFPMLGRNAAGWAEAYREYFARNAARAPQPLTMLDPAPRVVLDPELGVVTVGRSAQETVIAADIYRHTIRIILRAEALGGWQALGEADLFDMEYWDLEQAKLKRAGAPKALAGEIALVTGAASGIGKACAESLLARGAAVVGLDIDPAIEQTFCRPDFLGVVCDVTDTEALKRALAAGVERFGGLDALILNAGIFPPSARIAELTDDTWAKTLAVNVDANLALLREAHPYLSRAPRGGRVAVIASKNVPAPGPGAAAYSASKAALTQLARVAALEWASDDIRVNVLHPDAVFDTGLWSEEVLAARAAHYGLSVAQYKTKNLLRIEVRSRDVAELAAELCGPLFSRTTGAQIPVDGGNDRVV